MTEKELINPIDHARSMLRDVCRNNFTDKTFNLYIEKTLAGDFAVEIVRYIEKLQAAKQDSEKELQDFSAAIIEEYKASLVPVAWMSTDENHIEWRKQSLIELGFKDNEITPLYALPVGETK